MRPTNSKNWVACTSENGMPDARIRSSCAAFAWKLAICCGRFLPIVAVAEPPGDGAGTP